MTPRCSIILSLSAERFSCAPGRYELEHSVLYQTRDSLQRLGEENPKPVAAFNTYLSHIQPWNPVHCGGGKVSAVTFLAHAVSPRREQLPAKLPVVSLVRCSLTRARWGVRMGHVPLLISHQQDLSSPSRTWSEKPATMQLSRAGCHLCLVYFAKFSHRISESRP